MNKFTALKKVELHLHLEGAAEPDFVREICKDKKKSLPNIFNDAGSYKWSSFDEFLKVYEVVTELLSDEKSFEKLLRHVIEKQLKSNVIYSEIFLGPHLWGESISDKWFSFLRIAKDISDEFERDHCIYVRFIIVAIRHLGPEKAKEAAKFAVKCKEFGIVGFGMAGDESAFETSLFKSSFDIAGGGELGLTSHAGEICGPTSIKGAIDLGIKRIGHGVRAIEDKDLVKEILEKNIMLEICPGSNLRLGIFNSMSEHPINEFFKSGLALSISTDDPPFFYTDLNKEYLELHKAFGWDEETFNRINRNAINYAFCSENQKKKIKKQLIKRE